MKFSPAVVVIGLAAVNRVAAFDGAKAPDCFGKCWDNSRFVTECVYDDIACLCEDANYQNIVMQCLYSQCQTVHFGAALHHTLAACYDFASDEAGAVPPILRHQALRRRTNEDKDKSSTSTGMTVSARATQSAPASRFRRYDGSMHSKPTQSVSHYVRTSSATATATATSATAIETGKNDKKDVVEEDDF